MRRWHAEKKIAYRNWRNHRRLHIKSNLDNQYPDRIGCDPYEVDCECDNQIGRYRKKDAYDCGKPLCICCHYNKWLLNGGHEITRQEIKAHIKLREGIKELDD
jgi:hypothetical protein